MGLKELRNKIDKVDQKLILLLAKRQAYMPLVGKYKKEKNIKINQPKREKEILKNKVKLALGVGLDEKLTKKIFSALFKNAKEIQIKDGK